ncbi:DUF1552 domain-containing protein [Agarilytica rhodophyticola]|uniref:DUF1552 domain-containing protein n=1 Tax=Agarilytica rhodophyticola TaxID=1737490 RepID=UPI000B348399|nr:DUF1552 domain-containing protein [Agarilytica rhodophyticola]
MKNQSRRQFIKKLSGAAIAAPMLNLSWAKSVFAADAAKKVVFMYMPDGCIPTRFHPSQTGTSFTLPDQTSELESVRQHCVFPRGLTMYEGGSTHEGGAAKVLTGNNNQSIDYFLSQELGGATPFRGINLGVATNFQSGSDKLTSYRTGNIAISPNDNPINAFETIFAGNTGGGGQTTAQRRTQSILDTNKDDLQRLRNLLGAAEKAKLDEHAQAISEVEARLAAASGGACNTGGFNTGGFSVPNPDYGYPKQIHLDSNFETVAKLQMDIIVRALSCGMTRVASLSFSHAVSPLRVEGLSSSNHDSSHYGTSTSNAANVFSQYKRFYVRQLKYLIEALLNETDTDGNTMLRNTLIVFYSELGDGNRHDHKDMPFILAGNAGGNLVTGRALDYNGDAHSKLLVSIANMMDVNINSFGYTGHGLGGLANL